MAVDEVFASASAQLITEVGRIGLWMQALGLVVILWLFFEVTSFIINRKRMKEVYAIKDDMKRIEGKIDAMLTRLESKKK